MTSAKRTQPFDADPERDLVGDGGVRCGGEHTGAERGAEGWHGTMTTGSQPSNAREAPTMQRPTKEQRVTDELMVRELREHDFGILSTVSGEGKPFACPVCMRALESGSGWTIRHHGRWMHFRTRQCLDEYERRSEAYTGTDDDPRAYASPYSEWTCY